MKVFIKIGQPMLSPVLWGDFHFAYALKDSLQRRGIRSRVLFHENLMKRVKLEIVLLGLNMAHYCPPKDSFSVAWLISHPEQNGEDVLRGFSFAFVCSRLLSQRWGFEYLGQAYDARSYYTCPAQAVEKSSGPGIDVVFVGNGQEASRQQLLQALGESIVCVHVWGSFHPSGPFKCHAPILPWVAGDLYRRSRVVIGHHQAPARALGLVNDRVYSVIACGAFLLSDRVVGIHEDFPDVVTYDSPSEAVELCAYYLRHHKERRHIATSCLERNSLNSFDDRARRLDELFRPYV